MRLKFSLLLLLTIFIPLDATDFSSTRILYHYSGSFDKVAGSDAIPNGVLQTLTLEHASNWDYGSNFFFIDMNSAAYSSGKKYKVYSEWAPALSFSKIFKKELKFWILKDVALAGEINQAEDFQALNLGLRLSLDILGFDFFNANLFSRKDNFNEATFQVTLAWHSHFAIFDLPFIFEGFFDYYGVDFGIEIVSQPRFFIDGKSIGLKNMMFGTELYYYRSSKALWRPEINTLVPQLAIKWSW